MSKAASSEVAFLAPALKAPRIASCHEAIAKRPARPTTATGAGAALSPDYERASIMV